MKNKTYILDFPPDGNKCRMAMYVDEITHIRRLL